MTNPDDRFTAIAGVAKAIQENLGSKSRYLFGIWSDDLPNGLLWKRWKRHGERQLHRAPSWSWGCWDGTVSKINGYSTCYIQTGSLEEVDDSLDPVRAGLTSGARELKLKGPLKEAKCVTRKAFTRWIPDIHEHYGPQFVLDKDVNHKALSDDEVKDADLGENSIDTVNEIASPVQPLFVLRLFEKQALMLEHVNDQVYRRLGTLTVKEEKCQWFEDSVVRNITLI